MKYLLKSREEQIGGFREDRLTTNKEFEWA